MTVAIYGRKLKPKVKEGVLLLFKLLVEKDIEFVVYEPFYEHLQEAFGISYTPKTFSKRDEIDSEIEFVFSLGGDGTILDTVSWVGALETPIIGINMGRLGFLASISLDKITELVESIENGTYVIDKRNMITVEANHELFKESPFALNEFTIQRSDTSSMITVHTYLNGQHLNSYWADGLIISTATGSTGYSLSCGGPIIYPNNDNFIITPVAPHNLNVRPLVVSDDVVLSFQIEGRTKKFLATLDSRVETIDNSFEIAIKKAPFQANLVRLNDMNFLNAIKEKLNWGEDLRN
ncbi:MAG: NAD kinase [Chitinophagales bacterium]